MIIIWTVLFLVFVLVDLVPIIKKKDWKLLSIYAVLFVFSYVVGIAYLLNTNIPSPSKPIENLVRYVIGI